MLDFFQIWQNSNNFSFRGPAGVTLVCLVLSVVLSVVGFTTPAWSVKGTHHEGLLESCVCAANNNDPPRWFIYVQVASLLALIGIQVVMMLAWDHFYGNCLNKNVSIISMSLLAFALVIFLIVSFSIYGAMRNGLDWSYAFSVSGMILFFIAAVLGLVRWREINRDVTLEVKALAMDY